MVTRETTNRIESCVRWFFAIMIVLRVAIGTGDAVMRATGVYPYLAEPDAYQTSD